MTMRKEDLIQPLTEAEFREMLESYGKRDSEDSYLKGSENWDYEKILLLERYWQKMTDLHKKKHIVIYHVGVGIREASASNVLYILNFFKSKGIEAEIWNFEGRHENMASFVRALENEIDEDELPPTLHFHEADMYLERLEPGADIVIAMNALGKVHFNIYKHNHNHALFDNLVRGAKEGGYLILDGAPRKLEDAENVGESGYYFAKKSLFEAIEDVDLEAYGIALIDKALDRGRGQSILLKRVKMKPLLEFMPRGSL